MILELCAAHGIPAREADLTPADVGRADEIFLLGTMSGPVGAVALDGRPVGDGAIGPVTRQLRALYQEALVDPAQGVSVLE